MAEMSTMMPLGTVQPGYSLADAVSGRTFTDDDLAGRCGAVVMFLCNHCPFVQHVLPELDRVISEYGPKGIGFAAINSNDEMTYPQDGPAAMKQLVLERGWKIPFLFDETQTVAKAYGAACTPDFFAFDAAGRLAYRGRLDESRPNQPAPLTGRDLRAALDAMVAGRAPDADQKPSIGCGIKWKVNLPA